MTTVQLLLVLLATIAVAAIAAGAYTARRTAPVSDASCDIPLEKDVVVHMLSGTSVRGRVLEAGAVVRLTDASVISAGTAQALGGIARIPASQVGWTQEL